MRFLSKIELKHYISNSKHRAFFYQNGVCKLLAMGIFLRKWGKQAIYIGHFFTKTGYVSSLHRVFFIENGVCELLT